MGEELSEVRRVAVAVNLGEEGLEHPTWVDDCKQLGKQQKGGYGKVTYVGRSRKCIVVKDVMGLEEMRRMVTEITGSDLFEHKLLYNLKCIQQMLMAVERRGNGEHGYSYVGGNDGLTRRAQKAGAACERRTHTCDHGVVCTKSVRNGTTNVTGCLLRMLLMSTTSNLVAEKHCLCTTPILEDLTRGHCLRPTRWM
ncbi:hypothetical protein Cgig2_007548 [Carnegiea gigantea]|uniref:Uncharacterized protein n=1 Tax=Carnegiea gigantea TaxID=171969 RepID=A0A9Q1K5L8_9CARY|nr:hypothetical protein Cgig2_007548 [Carnegiea gigantea]